MSTVAAVSLVALCLSSSGLPPSAVTNAFAPSSSIARLPLNSLTRLPQTSDGAISDGGTSSSYPIKANQPLLRLTQQQEVSLLRQMRAHPASSSPSQMARQTLMLHNLPLVQSIVTKILRSRPHLRHGPGGSGGGGGGGSVPTALTRDDLLHEGTIGLAEAIDRYDMAYAQDLKDCSCTTTQASSSPSSPIIPKGARLGTYATYWIRARIVRAIQSREHAFRFPEHALQASHRLVRAAKDMGLKWDVVAELADFDVITVAQKKLRDDLRLVAGIQSESLFRDAVRVRTLSRSGATAPLESWMSPSSTLATGGADDSPSSSESGQEHVLEMLSKFLVPREVEVLSLRYGLVSSDEEEVEGGLAEQQVFRNYQAEAEEDLFGPQGVLSHYSDTSDEDVNASAVTSRNADMVSVAMPSKVRKTKEAASPSKALLPFKEIGVRMKFSGEYCRRTCTQALSKLTRAAEEGRLAESDFLLGW